MYVQTENDLRKRPLIDKVDSASLVRKQLLFTTKVFIAQILC